jgi:hypothetical protein
MKAGYEIVFITPMNRRYKGKLVVDLLADIARDQGIERMTRRTDSAGIGHGGSLHAAHFFELADQPEEVLFITDEAMGEKLLAAVEAQAVPVFCIKKRVEYGAIGNA